MQEHAYTFDIAVIGAGHAGIEAALAGARLGLRVVCFAMHLDSVANLPCNPAIGGTAKGHLVREIDALGGEMGKAADACCIQYRMLNRGKGPAVHSLRAQADRAAYHLHMKRVLEEQPGLSLRQAEVVDIGVEDGRVVSVMTHTGVRYAVKAAVLCTGTYLQGRLITGESIRSGGPDGLMPALHLTDILKKLGLPLMRFKTGTPPRVDASTVDFSQMIRQDGDDEVIPFSFATEEPPQNRAACYLTYTTLETHRIIRDNLHKAPMYAGVIEGVGARYCPSIEDKIVRFADKERHPVFVEPMGLHTRELYLQGMSSSFPEEIQMQIVRSVPGLQKAEMIRPAYAIEYDCLSPRCLTPALMTRDIQGFFAAGQVNGSSGYEEAAAQGLVAGINAARYCLDKPCVTFARTDSYIGVLIDDLVTKGVQEPYRMMTSRSEARLLLRQDNADLRLTPVGYEAGLIAPARYRALEEKKEQIAREITRLQKATVPPSPELHAFLAAHNSTPTTSGVSLADLIRRPELGYEMLAPFDPERPVLPAAVREQVEISIRYEGYIKRQEALVDKLRRMEGKRIPPDFDYLNCHGLRIEARQRLHAARPDNLGQASRVPGVNPADMTVLMIALTTVR